MTRTSTCPVACQTIHSLARPACRSGTTCQSAQRTPSPSAAGIAPRRGASRSYANPCQPSSSPNAPTRNRAKSTGALAKAPTSTTGASPRPSVQRNASPSTPGNRSTAGVHQRRSRTRAPSRQRASRARAAPPPDSQPVMTNAANPGLNVISAASGRLIGSQSGAGPAASAPTHQNGSERASTRAPKSQIVEKRGLKGSITYTVSILQLTV